MIEILVKGHLVNVIGPSDVDGWLEVTAKVNGASRQGFVAARLLRDPVSAPKERLMAAAVAEWVRFDKGAGKEHVDPYFKHVGEMWRAIGNNLDGRDRGVPWSAAFISWTVRQAGADYHGFRFAAAHARYIHDSIVKREAGTASPFWGFRLHQHKAELGDLVCQWRDSPTTYDDARTEDSFFSHCDVIVDVAPGSVRALGGNVGHSVGFKTYAINEAGFLKAENEVFAVLQNTL